MRDSLGRGPSSTDSSDDLLAGWNIEDPSCLSIPDSPDRRGDTDDRPSPAGTTLRPAGRAPGLPSADSLNFLDGFSLGEPQDGDSLGFRGLEGGPDGDTILRRDRHAGASWTGPSPTVPRATRPVSDLGRSRSSRDLPCVGDMLAGFRIIQELGRGAFARVFLAEEIHLGGRLVAIKVSRAEGDEPRILARLQHANIVPVHSVCDDPDTGLRVLCMPFFGGGNLAQVIDAAGGLSTVGRAGRSLVEALDQISRRQASLATEFVRPLSSRPRSTTGASVPARQVSGLSAASIGPASDLSVPAGASAVAGSAFVFSFRSLLSRIVGHAPAVSDHPAAVQFDDDPHQPALQYLRKATAVQAAAWIAARLAEGLDHAHSRGLLHRDLKPANILLAADGTPMLLDFNLAVESQPQSTDGEIGRALLGGTLPYMAPEHLDAFGRRGADGVEAVDERADIYALGLILFELLSGEHPFPVPTPPPGMSPVDVIREMVETRRHPASLKSRCPQVPWSLDALVAKCLEFEPARRYARARDLGEDLRRFLDDLPNKHAPEPSVRERATKFARRHQTLCSSTSIALISLAFILALGGAVAAVHGGMQGLMARFQRQAFERTFVDAQFLLNTAGASDQHLADGLARADDLFERLELDDGRATPTVAWFQRLTDAEQQRVREQLVELTILESRARVLLAKRRGTDADRQAAMRRAIARLDVAERVLDHAPAALYNERAQYHAALHDAALADRDCRQARLALPDTCHDWTLLGTTLLAAGESAAAEDTLRHALRLDVTSFWARFMMGHCHYGQGRFVEAAGDFTACTVLGPQFAWAHFNRGLALARAGLLNFARDAYDDALRLDPAFIEALVNRALVELELNDASAALSDLSLAIKLGRTEIGVLAAYGEALARLGRPDEALRRFDSLLESEPDNAVVRVARGMARLRSDLRGAREDFEHVLRRDPHQAAAKYGMARIVRTNELEGALKYLDVALDSDPHLVDAIQLRALVRARLGDPATLDDVDRLLKIPTAQRYYNAACAVAVYAEKAHQPQQLAHAMELLARAVELGSFAADAAADPDLAQLRDRPEFQRLLAKRAK
jgi:serine/threonine protein kinase/tetratricopeptide (TPR) repeat protein